MLEVAVIGPGQGEVVLDTPAVHMSILEDGSTTGHRLGVASVMSRYATEPATEYARGT